MSRPKCAENDPWSPLPAASGVIQQPPADPRYQLIDSGRYIESLEKKLNRIKGKQKQEPNSRDIIDSLALFRDDQMRRYIEKEEQVTTSPTITQDQDNTSATSYIQRKLHPERQAINVEELFELLKDDQLARRGTYSEQHTVFATTCERGQRHVRVSPTGGCRDRYGDDLEMRETAYVHVQCS
ncbi:hypothetical protein BaRGS_00018541, partial [Batillaria attramentaria]